MKRPAEEMWLPKRLKIGHSPEADDQPDTSRDYSPPSQPSHETDPSQSSQSPPHNIDRTAAGTTMESRKPHSSRRTWRVRGVPLDFDRNKLADVLRHHPYLRSPNEHTAENGDNRGNGVNVHTLAPDLSFLDQVATIRFDNVPPQLDALESKAQLVIKMDIASENPPAGAKRKRESLATLTIDEHFEGITTLFSPSKEEHQIDILAVCGLGAHPFGSFVNKGDGHMWLSDSLPRDIPAARVMITSLNSFGRPLRCWAALDVEEMAPTTAIVDATTLM